MAGRISSSTPNALYARRARLSGPQGISGLVHNGSVFAIAVFASLGGLVYGYNQGMFWQILNMPSFAKTVHPESISNPTARGLLTAILELGALWILMGSGISVGASSNWLNNFAVGMATSDMLARMRYGTYIFFGLFCSIGAAYIYFFVPETKGRTLEEMDELFQDDTGQGKEDMERLERIWRELGLWNESLEVDFEKEKATHEDAV